MVNIITEQQQANKELLNEIEMLKKQLSNKEQEITELKNLGEVKKRKLNLSKKQWKEFTKYW